MKRALFIAIAAAAAVTVRPDAYVLNASWPVQQVPYYVNPVNADVSQQAAIAAIQAGADGWSSQSNANVQLYYAGTTTGTSLVNNHKNEVFFRNESNGSLLASTYWWYDSTGHLTDADIVFYDASVRFYTGTSGCTGSYAGYIEDVATHEFGHALGLRHTTDTTATMYPTMTWCAQGWRTLGADDQAGIEALYPAAATSQAPTAPANLRGTGQTTSVQLAWVDQATDESGFAAERSTDGTTFAPLAQLGANAVSYVDSSVTSGRTYYYRVRSFNSGGYSAYSNIAPVATPAPAPAPAPTNSFALKATGRKVKSVRYADLSWTGSSATSLSVYRNGAVIKTVANTGAYTDPIAGKGSGTFSYKLCNSGTTTCSNTVNVVF